MTAIVGYAPGIYDLFHVGHLNILRRAKQHCDVLVAGVLSDEISRGERFELPAREHVLFRGGARELADPEWIGRVPWANAAMPEFTETPSLAWPDDRAWVLVTEVDYDSTIVAGSVALVQALVADPRLEAFAIPEGADLGWDADEVNR